MPEFLMLKGHSDKICLSGKRTQTSDLNCKCCYGCLLARQCTDLICLEAAHTLMTLVYSCLFQFL